MIIRFKKLGFILALAIFMSGLVFVAPSQATNTAIKTTPKSTWYPPGDMDFRYFDEHGPMHSNKIQVENHLFPDGGSYPPFSKLQDWSKNTYFYANLLNIYILPARVNCTYHGAACIKIYAEWDPYDNRQSWVSHWGPWLRIVVLNTAYAPAPYPFNKNDRARQLCRRFGQALGVGVGRVYLRNRGGSCVSTSQIGGAYWWVTPFDHRVISKLYPVGKGGR